MDRKEVLLTLLPKQHPRLRYVDYLETQGESMYQFAVKVGMEGVVGKRANSRYPGKRSNLWRKSKPAGFHDGWGRPGRSKRDG